MDRKHLLLGLLVMVASLPALAHTGVDHSFTLMAGLEHPVGGLDHLLAMVAVGLWGAMQPGKTRYLAPATFVGAMVLGCVLAVVGMPLPLVEGGIAFSVLFLGLMVACGQRFNTGVGLALIALFAIFHGHAHGSEAPAGSLVPYMAGFVLATATLHALGLFGGARILEKAPKMMRAIGILISASSLMFFSSLV